jgi:hypothetical protein
MDMHCELAKWGSQREEIAKTQAYHTKALPEAYGGVRLSLEMSKANLEYEAAVLFAYLPNCL